jgi:hypothetical protein
VDGRPSVGAPLLARNRGQAKRGAHGGTPAQIANRVYKPSLQTEFI